jgi:hypothetical protein
MCWTYSECGSCALRTYCISVCDCTKDEIKSGYCEHRDCKSFFHCKTCWLDLCDDCAYKVGYCEECFEKQNNDSEVQDE